MLPSDKAGERNKFPETGTIATTPRPLRSFTPLATVMTLRLTQYRNFQRLWPFPHPARGVQTLQWGVKFGTGLPFNLSGNRIREGQGLDQGHTARKHDAKA